MTECYHFIGIGGIGMSGLAHLLLCQQQIVTGSDITSSPIIQRLIEEGAMIYKGHAAEHVPSNAKVVYSSDIKTDNPEYQAAIKMQCPLLHRADLLAQLLKRSRSLAVAGTHGKTTTSALLASVLVEGGLDPSFAIGGILPTFQNNARLGQGDEFVFEADESDRSFLKYSPFGAIITNIDNDHLNSYEESFPLLMSTFKQFISQVQSTDHLFWCREDKHLTQFQLSGQSYGFHEHSDWRILSFQQEGFNLKFDLEYHGTLYTNIELNLLGRHNVLNAAAVFGLARMLGISEQKIRYAFQTFKGVLRRCENKGIYQQVQFLDDYAHHPTEIQTTLQGIRKAIGSQRFIAVFQPHRYSRTKDCLGSYGTIFNEVDELIITDIYGAGEEPIANLSSLAIKQEVEQISDISCHYISRANLSQFLSQFIQPKDVVMTLGAGDVTKLSHEIMELLKNHSNGS